MKSPRNPSPSDDPWRDNPWREVLEQAEIWVDSNNREQKLGEMHLAFLLNVKGLLERRAQDIYVAERVARRLEGKVDADRHSRDSDVESEDPDCWLRETPFFRALEAEINRRRADDHNLDELPESPLVAGLDSNARASLLPRYLLVALTYVDAALKSGADPDDVFRNVTTQLRNFEVGILDGYDHQAEMNERRYGVTRQLRLVQLNVEAANEALSSDAPLKQKLDQLSTLLKTLEDQIAIPDWQYP